MRKRRVAGCMTGTSMDGLDVALVEIQGKGLGIEAKLAGAARRPFGDLAGPLSKLAGGKAMSAKRIAELALALAELHLDALQELAGDEGLDLVAMHGQTVHHAPPVSWQLANPTPIAVGLGVPVVFDLRAADLAAGGQGAPITPIADYLMFRSPEEERAVVNLGGFANLTLLPTSVMVEKVRGGDLCVCNQLLDAIARSKLKKPFDEDGATAATGMVKARVYMELTDALAEQGGSGRSLGTGDELASWIGGAAKRLPGADVARTACAAIAKVIADHTRHADRVLLAGGGARNRTLVDEIRAKGSAPVELTDDHGVPVEAREAAAMAVLGALCQDREPISLAQVTGVPGAPPVAGCWALP